MLRLSDLLSCPEVKYPDLAVYVDFVKVEWVVQLDCPENTDTYTHRVGRTARMEATGQSLLVLRPNEEDPMVEQLQKAKIPLKKEK